MPTQKQCSRLLGHGKGDGQLFSHSSGFPLPQKTIPLQAGFPFPCSSAGPGRLPPKECSLLTHQQSLVCRTAGGRATLNEGVLWRCTAWECCHSEPLELPCYNPGLTAPQEKCDEHTAEDSHLLASSSTACDVQSLIKVRRNGQFCIPDQ